MPDLACRGVGSDPSVASSPHRTCDRRVFCARVQWSHDLRPVPLAEGSTPGSCCHTSPPGNPSSTRRVQPLRGATNASKGRMLSRHASGAAMQHEERTVSAASTVPMPSRSSSATMHEEHATSDASTLRKLPFSAASATAQQEMHASTDPDGAHAMLVLKYYNVLLSTPHSSPTASSSHDASPHQHPAVHHDLTSPCTPIASQPAWYGRLPTR